MNGRIYTVNEAQPWAEAVAIKDGKFLEVGSGAEIEGLVGDGTEVIDLGGRLVLRGLHDVHVHATWSGLDMVTSCTLPVTLDPSLEDFIAVLEACKETLPGDGWFRGSGYTSAAIPEDKYNEETLEELFPDGR